jgi:hypothetical protein
MMETACNKSDENQISSSSAITSPDVVGKRIEFKTGGDSETYRVSGWSKTEAEFTWTEGTAAKLALPISNSSNGLTLRITMSALIHPPELTSQPVELYANGEKLSAWEVGDTAEFVATIPADMTKAGGTLALEFKTPKATTPKALGVNADSRILGICVRSLQLTKK